ECFFFSSRRRHTRLVSDWSSDVCSSDLDKRGKANFTPLPDGILLKPGMTDSRVPILRQRLVELDLSVPEAGAVADLYDEPLVAEIGRASCRERVESAWVAGACREQGRSR